MPPPWLGGTNNKLCVINCFIVFDGWKWFVEVVKELLPFLILRGLPEPHDVIFQFLPLD